MHTDWIYYGFGTFQTFPDLAWERSFLLHRLSHPGGVVRLATALLSGAYGQPLLGGLVLTAALATLYAAGRSLWVAAGHPAWQPAAWIAPPSWPWPSSSATTAPWPMSWA